MSWTAHFDEEGRLEEAGPPGESTRFDSWPVPGGRLLTRELPDDGRVVLELDENGRRRAMEDRLGKVDYHYDDMGRVSAVQRRGLPRLHFTHDALDRLEAVRAGEFEVDYEYDFLGRLKAIRTPVGTVSYEHVPPLGRTTRTLPNGIVTTWTFDPEGRMESLRHAGRDGSTLVEFRYRFQSRRDAGRGGRDLGGGSRLHPVRLRWNGQADKRQPFPLRGDHI